MEWGYGGHDGSNYKEVIGKDGTTQLRFHFMSQTEAEVANESKVSGVQNWFDFSETNKQVVRDALKHISANTDIEFTEDTLNSTPEMGKINFYMGAFPSDRIAGYGYTGGSVSFNSNLYQTGEQTLKSKNGGFITVLHEVLHSLGLDHPNTYGVRDANTNKLGFSYPTIKPFPNTVPRDEDEASLTVMSYMREFDNNGQDSLRMYDLAYLHYRYGVNNSKRAGNDTYTFKPFNPASMDNDVYIWDGAGMDTFDASGETQGVTVDLTPGSWIFVGEGRAKGTGRDIEAKAPSAFQRETTQERFAYQDARGIYTFGMEATIPKHEFFGISNPQASFTYWDDDNNAVQTRNIDYTQKQAFIGFDTQIENLIGSDYGDVLTGNNANNIIMGGKGRDRLVGGAGDDFLDGGEHFDRYEGGSGNDTYVFDNISERGVDVGAPNASNTDLDTVKEEFDGGIDTILSYNNILSLSDNVEILRLLGKATVGYGNQLNNEIYANGLNNDLRGGKGDDIIYGYGGNDHIDGGAGKDTLYGGSGDDKFVLSSLLEVDADVIKDFTIGEDMLVLSRSVFSSLNEDMSNFNDHMKLDSSTGQLSYDADGTGGGAAVLIATLENIRELTQHSVMLA